MADEALKALVTEALYKHLDEKKREELIKSAIVTLLEPRKDNYSYGPGKSALQDAFEHAVRGVAFEIVREKIREDEALKAKVGELFAKAWAKAVEDSDALVHEMANGLVAVLTMRQK